MIQSLQSSYLNSNIQHMSLHRRLDTQTKITHSYEDLNKAGKRFPSYTPLYMPQEEKMVSMMVEMLMTTYR